ERQNHSGFGKGHDVKGIGVEKFELHVPTRDDLLLVSGILPSAVNDIAICLDSSRTIGPQLQENIKVILSLLVYRDWRTLRIELSLEGFALPYTFNRCRIFIIRT